MSTLQKLLVLAFVVTASFAGTVPHAAAADKPITLKMGFVDPESSNYAQGGERVAKEVARLTDGKVQIEVLASGQLGNERDMYEGAQIGSIDVCTIANAVMSSFIPEMAVLDQHFLFDSPEQAHTVIDGALGKLIAKKAEEQGVHIVGWMESGFRNTFSKKPITKPEEFKGMKIRTMENRMQIAAFNAMGAIATPMAFGEQFTALQQGTIDGAENAVANVLANRYYEVVKNITWTNHLFTFIAVGMSDKAWNRIPDDLKPKVLEGFKIGCDYQRELLLKSNAEAVVELKKLGVTFHEIDRDALKALVEPAMEPFRKDMNKEWLTVLEESKK
ncbi:MAG: Solute-binding protein [Desulfovibrio sp.]